MAPPPVPWFLLLSPMATVAMLLVMSVVLLALISVVSRPSDMFMDLKQRGNGFVNWELRVRCKPAAIVYPRTTAEVVEAVQAAVKAGTRLRAVGAGHSWNDGACTDGTMLSLDRMSRVLEIDPARKWVRVQGGARFQTIQDALAEHGLAFPCLPSVAAQSAAGLVQTATHGNGVNHAPLASQLVAVTLVTGEGRVLNVSARENPELMPAVQCALGSLGVFVELTFGGLVPAFKLTKDEYPLTLDEVLARLPALLRDEPFFKFWYFPQTRRVQFSRYIPTPMSTPTTDGFGTWLAETAVQQHAVNALLFTIGLLPRFIRAPVLRALFGLGFQTKQRVNRSDKLFNIPLHIRHQESEFAFRIEDAERAIRAVCLIADDPALCVNMPVEVRFVAADKSLLSPSAGRAACHITCTSYNQPFERFFARVETDVCRPMAARPHWGKTTVGYGPADFAALYPRYAEFVALRAKLDPARVFANEYSARVFGLE